QLFPECVIARSRLGRAAEPLARPLPKVSQGIWTEDQALLLDTFAFNARTPGFDWGRSLRRVLEQSTSGEIEQDNGWVPCRPPPHGHWRVCNTSGGCGC